MDKIKILFLAANAIKKNMLDLGEEFRQISNRLRASEHGQSFDLVPAFEVRPDEFAAYLLRHRPDIVHFSGHGNKKGEIVLAGKTRRGKTVSKEAFEELFAILKDKIKIKVVVLNACYSEAQAKLLTGAGAIDCAVGMDSAVSDRAAIAFAASFYEAIGFGESVQTAFDLARNALARERIRGERKPQLETRPGILASDIVLIPPTKAEPLGAPPEPPASALQPRPSQTPALAENPVTVYFVTIKEQAFDLAPDYTLDWRDYFVKADQNTRGHQLKNPCDWNAVLLPQLWKLEREINKGDCRLIRARGLARLSVWFAFGRVFCAVNRYVIEANQWGKLWRTDAEPSPDFRLLSRDMIRNREADVVAVGISVKDSLEEDVKKYLDEQTENVAAFLHLRPERNLGDDCLRSAGDAVALAVQTHRLVREFVRQWSAKRVMLFYYGPLSAACYIGHRLTAIGCQELQVMEDLQPGYAPSFLLRV